MGDQMQNGFRRLAEQVLAQTSGGRTVQLEAGLLLRWLSGYRDPRHELVWRFEDHAGNEYLIGGQLPRTVT